MQTWIPWMGQWLNFISKSVVVTLATLAVFEGARRFSPWRTAWKTKAAAYLAGGMVVLCGYGGTLLRAGASGESSLQYLVHSRPVPVMPESRLAQMTPEDRERITRLLARMEFDRTGALRNYISVSGQSVLYAPSESEIRNRELIKVTVASGRITYVFIRAQGPALIMTALIALLAGLYARRVSKGADCP